MQTLKERYEAFLQIEEEYGLLDKKIAGIRFWELARTNIFLRLLEQSLSERKEIPKTMELFRKLIYYLKALFNLRYNPFFCGEKDILFSGGQRRVLNESDGFWWDMHVDPLLRSLNFSYASLEYPVGVDHRTPAKTPNLFHFDVVESLGFIRKILGVAKIKLTLKEKQLLANLRTEYKNTFEVDLDVKGIVVSRLQEREETLPVCMSLLKRIKPKVVVIVTSYAREILIEACKLLSIPVIELQHGVITPYHPGYSYPNPKSKKLRFPDYLLVFGQYWKEHTKYPIPLDRITATGFPYLESQVNSRSLKSRKKQILIISQNRLGELISKFALELSKVPNFNYQILYKLHPLEYDRWREMYPWLVNTNLTILDDPKTDLYNLFNESEIQIGVASTAVYEGLAFGLKTYILDVPGSEYFQPLIDEGQVHKISSAEVFIKHLTSATKSVAPDIDYIFARNGVHLTIEFINGFLERLDSELKKDR
ncbi:MAG: hypothetical protein ACTSV2_08135 [Candidatus Thorarchaeota archaeon]